MVKAQKAQKAVLGWIIRKNILWTPTKTYLIYVGRNSLLSLLSLLQNSLRIFFTTNVHHGVSGKWTNPSLKKSTAAVTKKNTIKVTLK
jgi:hypothetical protein